MFGTVGSELAFNSIAGLFKMPIGIPISEDLAKSLTRLIAF